MSTITTPQLRGSLDGTTSPVTIEAVYDTADPYALTVTFTLDGAGDEQVKPWMFARDLLTRALSPIATGLAVGEGDVQIRRLGTSLIVSLSSPDGQASIITQAAPLAAFLGQTYIRVPLGAEQVGDIDAEWAALAGGAA